MNASNDNNNNNNKGPSILWSSILRDDIVLVEAHIDIASVSIVNDAAQQLIAKKPTPGWEHVTVRCRRNNSNENNHNNNRTVSKLRGTKFHVYDHYGDGQDNNNNNGIQSNKNKNNNGLTLWTFCCVYDPSVVDEYQAKAFLEKIVTMTEVFRQPNTIQDYDYQQQQDTCNGDDWFRQQQQQQRNGHRFSASLSSSRLESRYDTSTSNHHHHHHHDDDENDGWRTGSMYCAQKQFSPVLRQRMEEVSYLGKLALCHEQLNSTKEVMARNIELILEQEERLENVISKKAEECNEMAFVFKKKSKDVKRRMMWNNAKYGALMGIAVTAGVATVAVPTLIAIL